jgi:uncharacterized membrane protein
MKEFKNNRVLIVAFLGILIFSQFLLQFRGAIWPKLYMLLAIIAAIIILSFSRLRDNTKLARNAFILIFVLGTLNALILPIRQNLDENTHYYHTLQLADGKIRNQTDEKNFLMVSPDFLAVTKLPSKPEDKGTENTNLYSKEFMALKNIKSDYKSEWLNVGAFNNPAYLPGALGIVVGRLVSNKLSVSYYLGRIFNLFTFAMLAFFSIKISKKYKLQLFAIATLPYTLWITAGYSYDSIYYGFVLLMVAQLTNFLSGEVTVTNKRSIAYALSCLVFVFCKPPMVLFVILPFFLKKKNFADSNGRLFQLITVVATAILTMLWMMQGTIFKILGLIKPVAASAATAAVDTVATESRVHYFISHPVYTVEVLLRNIGDLINTISNSIQDPQPYLMPKSTLGLINLILFIVILIFITREVKFEVDSLMVKIILFVSAVIIFAIFYAISGDDRVFKIGDLRISGIQGRYFYYLLAFLPLVLSPLNKRTGLLQAGTSLQLDSVKVTNMVVRIVFLLSFANSCVALFGYL